MNLSPMSPTVTTAEIAMQRSPAEPYAAETAASAAMSIGVRQDDHVVFRAPSAWTRFPFAVPVE